MLAKTCAFISTKQGGAGAEDTVEALHRHCGIIANWEARVRILRQSRISASLCSWAGVWLCWPVSRAVTFEDSIIRAEPFTSANPKGSLTGLRNGTMAVLW